MAADIRDLVDAIFRRLPVVRAIYSERDQLKRRNADLEASLAGSIDRSAHQIPATGRTSTPDRSILLATIPGDPHTLEISTPSCLTDEQRIRLTERCPDADDIPKVAHAGSIEIEPDGMRVQIMHNGIKVVAGGYYGEWMQTLITRCKGHHEPQEERLFHEILRFIPPTAAMIEIGGYWSYYSIWFLSQGANRRSLIVEPDPVNLEVGRTNARLNNCAPEFIQAFASREETPPTQFQTETSGSVLMAGVSVPSLMETRGVSHLDILHCDCQGGELTVLESCRALFAAGRIGWVVVSTHSHHISADPLTHQRCLSTLIQAGATIVAEHDVQESFSGDGLIVAKFGALPTGWRTPPLTHNRYSSSLFRNPLYDLAAALREQRAPASAAAPPAAAALQISERDVARFLKAADAESRIRLFDAFGEVGLSDFLYIETAQALFLVNAKDQFISKDLFAKGTADYRKFVVALDLLKTTGGSSVGIDLLVDVGANIGSICIPAVTQGSVSRSIAVEPHATNCRLLRANIHLNGLANQIEVVERAAAATDDAMLEMELSSDYWGDHRISRSRAPGIFGEADRVHIDVPSIRLDSIAGIAAAKCVVIWMDIQGYEGHALLGAARVLEKTPPLVLEFWPYGMLRADSFGALCRTTAHYRGFYDLAQPNAPLRAMSELKALFDEIGSTGHFTDILVV